MFHRNGREIKDYYTAWKSACKRAGVTDANGRAKIPHDFRRTAARNLVRAGVSENVAMKLTGHKTRSVFDRYDIVSNDDLIDATKRLARFHGAHKETQEEENQAQSTGNAVELGTDWAQSESTAGAS